MGIPCNCSDSGQVENALADRAASLNSTFWKTVADCLEGKLLIQRGEWAKGSDLLRAGLEVCEKTGWMFEHSEFLGALADGLAGLGELAEALATIDRGLALADRGRERWCHAELLRRKGELLLEAMGDQPGPEAEKCFEEAMDVARDQGALFWELRVALSIARLRLKQDRPEDARATLALVYGRFTEGFETADLRSSRAMPESLAITAKRTSRSPAGPQ
jgi:predicted ATPase